MGTHTRGRRCVAALAVLVSTMASTAFAAVPVHIVKADLKAGIRAGVDTPVQFAVLVPHAVSSASGGVWSTSAGGSATWRYAVEIPTAVSLSFHATRSSLPESAVLVVRGAQTTASYRARDLHRGDLWSRIQPGEALEFTLTVAAADRSKVSFNIVSLQAGYRSLGAGVQDHPYYRQLKAQRAAASGNASCVTNYECQVTTSNSAPGQATVALVIGNLYQCSGVLINDVPGDNTPYILTARHCETGQLSGGNPGAASTVTVYWDATTTPCGAALGSIYDGAITQTGAQTIVEQQDAWLIKLDANPTAQDAQFAGFDATGGAVQGGYTIHHAEGYDKQFTSWYGQAYPVADNGVLGVTYLSNFWETVNQIGNIGPGASGSGLFDQNNHLVGSLTLGRTTADPSGYGACPVAPFPAPNGSNGVADFTALWAVWNSTLDTTSSTGSTTIKSVLDPANTGILVVPSQPAEVVTLTATEPTATYGVQVGLTWSALNATQCTAGGGVSGDGWSGTLPVSGAKSVTESSGGTTTYTLSCTFSGNRTATASVIITWVGPTPTLQFTPSTYVAWTASPVTLSWTSNVAPCAISGGALSLNNLPASGTRTTTQTTVGDVVYTLSCGPANDSAGSTLMEQWIAPNLMLRANGTDRLLGQAFDLQWDTAPNTVCSPSGGAPNDGWASTSFAPGSIEEFSPQVTTLGTYTYTLQCSAGTVSQQQSVTVTFENNAPYVNGSLNASSVTFSDSPADYVTLTYTSNLSVCGLVTTPNLPLTNSGSLQVPPAPQGIVALAPAQSGTYQISLKCDGPPNYNVTFPPLTLIVSPPPPPTETITFSPGNTVVVQEPFTISWSSTNAQTCSESGNIPGQNIWGSQFTNQPPSGHVSVFASAAGQFTIGLSCQSIDPNTASTSTSVTLNVVNLTATLSASATSVATGGSFTLTWSSNGATGCTASGGGANGSTWSGSLGPSGSVTQTATTSGTFTYTLDCNLNNQAASSQATVTVSAPSSGGGSSSGGHGGGGAIGWLELGSLVALFGLGRMRRPRIYDALSRPSPRADHAAPLLK